MLLAWSAIAVGGDLAGPGEFAQTVSRKTGVVPLRYQAHHHVGHTSSSAPATPAAGTPRSGRLVVAKVAAPHCLTVVPRADATGVARLAPAVAGRVAAAAAAAGLQYEEPLFDCWVVMSINKDATPALDATAAPSTPPLLDAAIERLAAATAPVTAGAGAW